MRIQDCDVTRQACNSHTYRLGRISRSAVFLDRVVALSIVEPNLGAVTSLAKNGAKELEVASPRADARAVVMPGRRNAWRKSA